MSSAQVPVQGVFEWAGQGSNLQPTDYESAALTIELPALCIESPIIAHRYSIASRKTCTMLGSK